MTGFGVGSEELHGIANQLRDSTSSLESAAQSEMGDVNAGRSTPAVQVTIATLTRAAAGLLDGTARTADDVASGRTDYLRTDEAAGDHMPKSDGGN